MSVIKFLKNIKNSFIIWYERHFGEYTPVRDFNYKKAQEFYETHKNDLDEMAFCMGFDDSIWSPIIENGKTISPPICFDNVDGVRETSYDIPCFYYCFKSGKKGKMYCFREWSYNKKSQTYKYVSFFGVPKKLTYFGVFYKNKFKNKFEEAYGKYKYLK